MNDSAAPLAPKKKISSTTEPSDADSLSEDAEQALPLEPGSQPHRSRPIVHLDRSEDSAASSDEVMEQLELADSTPHQGVESTEPDHELEPISDDDEAEAQPDVSAPTPLSAFDPPSAGLESLVPPYEAFRTTAALRTQLAAWATKWKVADDPYTTGLSVAIEERENLSGWSALNANEMLPYPTIRHGARLRSGGRLLLAIRNVCVFVPVALTWLAINKATDAFGALVRDNPGSSVNFLEFWESGGTDGKYLARFWRIQSVAFLDALIIAFIIGATLVASMLESRSRSRSLRQNHHAEIERKSLAIAITQALQSSKSATPQSISEALAVALGDLVQTSRDLGLAAARMESASTGVGSLTPRVIELSKQTEILSKSLAEDVNRTIEHLGKSVSTLGVTLGGDMQRFLTDVLAGLEEVSDRLGKTSVSVEFGTKQLRDDLDAMHARLGQLTSRRP